MGSQQCWLRSAANLTQSTPPHHLKFGSGGRSGSLSFRSPAVTADTCQVRLRQFRGGNPRVWRSEGWTQVHDTKWVNSVVYSITKDQVCMFP